MSSWDEFDKIWEGLIPSVVWDRDLYEYNLQISSFSGMEVDEDLTISVSVVFPAQSLDSVEVNQRLFVGFTEIVESDFRSSRVINMNFSGNFEGVPEFKTDNNVVYGVEVVYPADSSFDYGVGSLYNVGISFEVGSTFNEDEYVVLSEGVSCIVESSFEGSTKYITEVACTFNSSIEFEIKTHSWGRPTKPEQGLWSQPDAVTGVWVDEVYNGKKDWS